MDPLSGLSMHKISRVASITPFAQADVNKAALLHHEQALSSLEQETKPHELVSHGNVFIELFMFS